MKYQQLTEQKRNLNHIIILSVLAIVQQSCFIYNLITYSFLITDIVNQFEHMYQNIKFKKIYKHNIVTYFQVIILIAIFYQDVHKDYIIPALITVTLEIVCRKTRKNMIKDDHFQANNYLSIVLASFIIIIYKILQYQISDIQIKSIENPIRLMIYLGIMIGFSLIVNKGISFQLKKDGVQEKQRNKFTSLIIWILLVINEVLEPGDFEWVDMSILTLYFICAILEVFNSSGQQSKMDGILVVSQNIDDKYNHFSVYNLFRHIKSDKTSRKIFIIFCLNIAFMFVELIYGILSNSLSLISDSAHMLFDSSALMIGLYASFMSQLKPNLNYTFGYKRFKVLSGFINGLLLIFVGFNIFVQSILRIYNPQKVLSEKMMTVSVMGLLINILGLVFFHEYSHPHDEDSPCSHGHGHSHSHSHNEDEQSLKIKNGEEANHDHSHSHGHNHAHSHGHSHDHGDNQNMSGVFLHILADALGSVGAIISALLIYYKQWYVADSICSFIVSLLILTSVKPLIESSKELLTQQVPEKNQKDVQKIIHYIEQQEYIKYYVDLRYYAYTSTIHDFNIKLIVTKNENEVLRQFKEYINKNFSKIKYLTVQTQVEANSQDYNNYDQL